jgi:hypothetical protein
MVRDPRNVEELINAGLALTLDADGRVLETLFDWQVWLVWTQAYLPAEIQGRGVFLGRRDIRRLVRHIGGDGGIRTLDRALQPYNGLANRRLQPLGHVSDR